MILEYVLLCTGKTYDVQKELWVNWTKLRLKFNLIFVFDKCKGVETCVKWKAVSIKFKNYLIFVWFKNA